ncbi:MAG: hypothetical protein K8L97_06100 [Anaerolineae bacterium]|nr:hypothetical protein [Anaerolineae bacterium]
MKEDQDKTEEQASSTISTNLLVATRLLVAWLSGKGTMQNGQKQPQSNRRVKKK